MAEFLLEIGLDEIPARMLAGPEAELGRRVKELLTREQLLTSLGTVITYSTPRRLAVHIEGVALSQPDSQEQLLGPSWKVGFPNGAEGEPGPAAIAFARKAGVQPSALVKIANAKGEYLGASIERKGRDTAELLAAELPKEVLGLYWAKSMYWRAGKPERFVRPIRWLVALLGPDIVPITIAGITAGSTSRGHRILHGETPVEIGAPAGYLMALRKAYVEPNVAARRHTIRKALDHVTRAIEGTAGARWREDEALVETVVHLTEWPTVLYGSFEPEYLALPEEVLVTVMRDHQKYFAVEDATGKLAPHFLTVLNTQVDEKGEAIIRHGNERVLRSRFKDAQFFWEMDQKIPLADRVELLDAVTFQKDLGSYRWKTEGNLRVAERLAALVRQRGGVAFDETALLEAVKLAKSDLTAELVKEFTELQGIIGGLYARHQGMSLLVSAAIYTQYMSPTSERDVPFAVEGYLLGLADRIHTIVSMFSIGNAPTGSKDPFALRRAGNAVISILAFSELPLGLSDVVEASGGFNEAVLSFLVERLSFYLKESRGFTYDVINAVLASGSDDVRDAEARALAVTAAHGSLDFLAVSSAFKRMKNILLQAIERGELISSSAPDISSLTHPEELALLKASSALAVHDAELRQQRNYAAALEAIATLRPVVDAFFDNIMVMAPEPELRAARLALIQSVLNGFSGIADFSEIVIA